MNSPPQVTNRPSTALARELVMAHGWNSTACQILNPGIEHWFSSKAPAVVGYARCGRCFLVAGAPVSDIRLLREVCSEFESFARTAHCTVCYVCAEERLVSLFAGSGDHRAIALGAQPVWDPRSWPGIVRTHSSLRAQLNRARNKGLNIEQVAPDAAATNSALRRVLDDWLDSRRLPPLHFLVEPDVLDGVMTDRVVLVGSVHDHPVAFLVASPVVAKNGYLVELLARSPSAPNGTAELLIDAAMHRFADEHRDHVTLGLVALAQAAEAQIRGNPVWLRTMMHFARLHANRYYNFCGLEHFRTKMAPLRWEPIYAIANEPSFSFAMFYRMCAAFSGMPPWRAVLAAITKSIHSEFRRSPAKAAR